MTQSPDSVDSVRLDPSQAGSIRERKVHLREQMRSRLLSHDRATLETAGAELARRVVETPHWKRAQQVAVFVSLRDEIDSRPLMERVLATEKRLLLPRMTQQGGLDFIPIRDLGALVRGTLGVLEPDDSCIAVTLGTDTLVCVPGLAFDAKGRRLGRGKGYYDRALGALDGGRPFFLGVGLDDQLVRKVPAEKFDVSMDAVVTERAFVYAESRLP